MAARHRDVRHFNVLVLAAAKREVYLRSSIQNYRQHRNSPCRILFKVHRLQNHVVRIGDVDIN
jgi:hypothetical protein